MRRRKLIPQTKHNEVGIPKVDLAGGPSRRRIRAMKSEELTAGDRITRPRLCTENRVITGMDFPVEVGAGSEPIVILVRYVHRTGPAGFVAVRFVLIHRTRTVLGLVSNGRSSGIVQGRTRRLDVGPFVVRGMGGLVFVFCGG